MRGQLTTEQASPLPRQRRANRRSPGWAGVGAGATAGAAGAHLAGRAGAGGTAPGPMYQAAVPIPSMHQTARRMPKRWRPKPVGAERLFNYMEASDSEDEDQMNSLVCHLCAIEFLDVVAMETHMVTHHHLQTMVVEERAYRCSLCGFGSTCNATHAEVVAHMQTHAHVIELRCAEPGCRYVTSVHGALEEHVRQVHPSLPPLNQKCPHCGFVVLSALALSRHQKTHHLGSVACSACTRVLGRFERHKNGEMWTDNEIEEEEDVTPSLDAVVDGAEDGGEVLLGEPRVVAVALTEQQAIRFPLRGEPSEREAALRILRAQARARWRRVRRYRRARAAVRKRIGLSRGIHTLRDKYLERLVSRRCLPCHACPLAGRLIIPVHTTASLCLHVLWRHGRNSFPCDSCEARFRHRYQMLLHACREHAIAEPIVTLTVPQIITQHQLTQMTTLDPHQLHIDPDDLQHQQLLQQPQFVTHEVFQAQAPDGVAPATQEETYTIDNTRITVSVPVLYACPPEDQQSAQLPQQPQQDQDMYNSMMVPKQVWYPQLTTTPSYYISTQFPST